MPKTQRDCLRSPRTTKEDATERTTELNCWNKFDGQQNLQPSPQEDELRCGDIEKRKYYFSDQTFNYIEFQRISTDFDRFHELSSTFGSRYSGGILPKRFVPWSNPLTVRRATNLTDFPFNWPLQFECSVGELYRNIIAKLAHFLPGKHCVLDLLGQTIYHSSV